jgi:ketosteroid isomerase-like protein
MQTKVTAAHMEGTIRRYFDACNAANYQELVSCFAEDAIHYFPSGLPNVPWRGADQIARGWLWCVETFGSQWTIERILCSSAAPEAVIEWTHWKTKKQMALRGAEWYAFDALTGRISEIRAYYASPADGSVPVNELPGFDYSKRGYSLRASNESPRFLVQGEICVGSFESQKGHR